MAGLPDSAAPNRAAGGSTAADIRSAECRVFHSFPTPAISPVESRS